LDGPPSEPGAAPPLEAGAAPCVDVALLASLLVFALFERRPRVAAKTISARTTTPATTQGKARRAALFFATTSDAFCWFSSIASLFGSVFF